MAGSLNVQTLVDQGKQAFQSKHWEQAAAAFQAAARAYAEADNELDCAEMKNNLSVTWLQAGRAQDALEAARGTDAVFEKARDLKRQGMALGNQAAALEALKRPDEALAAYERSAAVLAEAGEGDLRAMVLKSAAALKLKRGKVSESAFKMIGSLDAKQSPSVWERVLRSLLHFIQR